MNKDYYAMNDGNALKAEFVGKEVVTCIDCKVRKVKFSFTVVRTYFKISLSPFNACPHCLINKGTSYSSVAHLDFKKKALSASLTSPKSIRPSSVAMRLGPFGYLFPSPTTTTLSRGGGGRAIYGRGGPPSSLARLSRSVGVGALFWAFQEFRRGEVSERCQDLTLRP